MKKVKYSKHVDSIPKKKKNKKHKEVIWGLFIAIIMVSSMIGYMYSGDTSADYTYKDKFGFIRTDSGLFIYKDDSNNQFTFRFLPSEVEEFKITTELNSAMVYLTFDPNSTDLDIIELMRYELSEDLKKLNIFTNQGITKPSLAYNMNIIDCINATPTTPVIKFINSNTTSITENNGCITLKAGSKADVVKLKERVLYKALRIIE